MAANLEYLTTQDLIWINQRITGSSQPFHFAKLEEATAYQYSYRTSNSLVPQAARFAAGFAKLVPFKSGNLGTGFIALAAFLYLNGKALKVSDAWSWFNAGAPTADSIDSASTDHHGHHITPRQAVEWALEEFSASLNTFKSKEELEFVEAKAHIRDVTSSLG